MNTISEALSIHACDDFILTRFSRTMRTCSSAPLNGGISRADNLLNLKVSGEYSEQSPAVSLQLEANRLALSGTTIGMMTAASMNSFRQQSLQSGGVQITACVTNGLHNLRAIGDRHDVYATTPPTGTINLWAYCNLSLSDAALVEAIMMMTEAKTTIMQQLGFRSPVSSAIATGTGTDAVAIICDPRGTPTSYIGKHTLQGELLGKACLDVLRQSLDWPENARYKS